MTQICYFPKHLFCFLLLVFANNLLILFWFLFFLAVMRSVGEFSVSESSVERAYVLWVVLFSFSFFSLAEIWCVLMCAGLFNVMHHGIPNCALNNHSCFVEHNV